MPNIFYYHLDPIAFVHKEWGRSFFADAARGAGNNDIAGAERRKSTDIANQIGNFMDHTARRIILNHDAVQIGLNRQTVGIGYFINSCQAGTKRAGLPPVFPGGKPGMLSVAHRTIHIAAIACNMAQGSVSIDIHTWFANNNGQLTFIIKFIG